MFRALDGSVKANQHRGLSGNDLEISPGGGLSMRTFSVFGHEIIGELPPTLAPPRAIPQLVLECV